MIEPEEITFNKLEDPNDLSVVEGLIYPIFSKKNAQYHYYWKEIKRLFLVAMKNANLGFLSRNLFWFYVNRVVTQGSRQGIPLIEVEANLRKFLRKRVAHHNYDKDHEALVSERTRRSFALIKDYVLGEKILDLGAGDGRIALEIKNQLNKEVFLVDIIDYNTTSIPLLLYDPKKEVPLADKEVDTTILYTVLHHANNPTHLLTEASRITKKRLIIVEGYIEEESVRMTNSFFDWFYNRIIGDEDIIIPLNFLEVKNWVTVLKSYGFSVVKSVDLGINEPIVPEHQVLIIADHID